MRLIMIRRPTIILLIILALLIGLALYLKYRPAATPEEMPAFGATYLFAEDYRPIVGLRIESIDRGIVAFERTPNGPWTMLLPKPGEADQAAAEAAATQVSTLRILTSLETAPSLESIGLKPSTYKITVKFASGKEVILRVGDLTITGSGYYVQRDEKIYVVAMAGIDALLNLLNAPPYAPTAAPTPEPPAATPTETAIETPSTPTVTPEATTLTPETTPATPLEASPIPETTTPTSTP